MGRNSSSNMASTRPPTYSTPRPSQRIWLTMPIHVLFEVSDRLQRAGETSTLVVNAHGALILLTTEVTVGQRLTLADIRTEQKRECRVVMIGFRTSNVNEVGVELREPFDGFGERSIRQEIGRSSEKRGSKMLLRPEQSCKARPFVWGICPGQSLAQKKSNHPFGPGSVGRP